MVVNRPRSVTSKTAANDKKNIYKTSKKYLDRNSASFEFPELDITIKRLSTFVHLLKSDEVEVLQKTIYHLDKFASLGTDQIKQMYECKLYDSIVNLCSAGDLIIKRFAFKLLVQMTLAITDCKKLMLNDDTLITNITEVFKTSADEILVEFSSVLLQIVCDDPKRVDSLGRDEPFLKNVFNKFKSPDADILLHSMRLLNIVMKNSMLIESIMKLKDFPFKNLQIELKSQIPEIQLASLDSFLIITNVFENPFWDQLSSDLLNEVVCKMCMQESNTDVQQKALMVFRNVCTNQKILTKLSQSDYLVKFVEKFMQKLSTNRGLLLSIVIEFAKIDDNRRILCENGIVKEIMEILKTGGSSTACDAINVMSTNIFCLREILSENVYIVLMNVAMNEDKEWANRNLALTSLLKLINIQGFKYLLEISSSLGEKFAQILKESKNLSFKTTAISILVKLSEYQEIKSKLAETSLTDSLFSALSVSTNSTNLTIRFFNLAANFMDQKIFREAFIENYATVPIGSNLNNAPSSLRSAAGNFINAAANYPELCEILIRDGILKRLMENFDCTFFSDAFETILSHDLSMKFAIRGRLQANEKIKSGFFATKGNWIDFQRLRELLHNEESSPFNPVYTINFEDNSPDLMLGGRTISRDNHLVNLVNETKNDTKFWSCNDIERIKLLAVKVSKFLQTDDDCISHQLHLHLTELKFKFGSSVIPLGNLICGNSFEAALLFKALADQHGIGASFHADDTGKGWNRVCNDTNVIDLVFAVGEMYEGSSLEARKYLQKIS